jgi:GNAT superfamily N-acetyltransferase
MSSTRRTVPFRVAILSGEHNRTDFRCGSPPLDRYFQQQVTQDIKRRVASCFVALDSEQRIAGFYTLASSSVSLIDLPQAAAKKLPRYPSVPAVRMGRLAVDETFKGKGLGSALLADALERTLRSDIAAFAMLVDAKDESAAGFYEHHGWQLLSPRGLILFLPLATAQGLITG